MNTTTFTTGDIVRFESGKEYKVTGIMPDGQLQVRGQRHGKDFGAIRIIDPARTKLVRRAADQAQPAEAPQEAGQPPAEADRFATPEQRKEWLRAFPGTPSAPGPAPAPEMVTGSIPVIIPRTDYWDLDTYQHASPAAQASVDAVFAAVEDISLPHLSVGLDHKTYHVTAQFSVPGEDPAFPTAYLVGIMDSGELIRLARLVWTGEWTEAGGLMDPEPKTHWRTVGRFASDRVGRVLARSVELSARPQLPRWMQASTR